MAKKDSLLAVRTGIQRVKYNGFNEMQISGPGVLQFSQYNYLNGGSNTQGTGHRSRVTGRGSRVAGRGSQVAGYGSQVTGCRIRSQIAGHGSQV